ncbi:MAG: GLPGLI family protein [Flavobacteriaceae bacterium]|nr:GLPGLI family protein [Flavobacteriaceae bacterium]
MLRKIILSVAFSAVSFLQMKAQEFQGMAVYESKTSNSDFKTRMQGNKDMTPDLQKMIEERMKKMFEKTFILNFNKSSSIYKEEEKLEAPGQGGGGGGGMRNIWSSMMGGGGTNYKNVKQKTYSVDKEFMGKEFLIKDSLPNYAWKMESETKLIGGYNCFKATAVRPVSQSDFRNFRSKKEDAKSEVVKPEGQAKKTNFMDDFELPKEITITAWYSPEIPINQGPENYWGLPGLILEVNDGKTIILCSKIILNSKEKTEIKESTNGKVISQKEYDETVVKKMEEFRQMNQGNGGMRMGR